MTCEVNASIRQNCYILLSLYFQHHHVPNMQPKFGFSQCRAESNITLIKPSHQPTHCNIRSLSWNGETLHVKNKANFFSKVPPDVSHKPKTTQTEQPSI